MNDTHPSLAVAELMRVLVDGHHLEWKQAWEITEATLGYTNHTLLPEALEKWPLSAARPTCSRGTSRSFRRSISSSCERSKFRGPAISTSSARCRSSRKAARNKSAWRISLWSAATPSMAFPRSIASSVKTTLAPDFYALWPEKFNNKTNGIAPRRWLLKSNPGLSPTLHRCYRRQVDHRSSAVSANLNASPTTPLSAVSFSPSSSRTKFDWPMCIRKTDRHRRRSQFHLRRAGEAHPRIQAAIAECAAHHRRIPAPHRRRRRLACAAYLYLRRKSRARILGRQADHQAHPQRRRCSSTTTLALKTG